MCSCVAVGCGAVKRGVKIAGEAVMAAAGKARKGTVMWCVGTKNFELDLSVQSAENLQCIKQYVLAPPKISAVSPRFTPLGAQVCCRKQISKQRLILAAHPKIKV